MTFRTLLFLIGLYFSLSFNVFCGDVKKMLFTSPIIYKPVIEMAKSKIKEPLNKRTLTKIGPFKIRMLITQFQPNEKDKEGFDEFVQISFKEISDIKFLIFKNNNFIRRLYVVRTKGNSASVVKYKRELDSLTSEIPKGNKAYIKKTQKFIKFLLKQG